MTCERGAVSDLLAANPVVGEPKVGERRFWTGREEKVLREHYPAGGLAACLPLLPGRTASAIYNRAGQLGLNAGKRCHDFRQQRWTSNDHIDALIRRTYQQAPEKNAINRLAQVVGRPRWWVSKRAVKLGCVAPRFKQPPWSTDEDDIVQDMAHRALPVIQRRLKARGFHRSETAIGVRLKRLGADRSDPDHYTARGLGELMGVDAKTVTGWIGKGWLIARRRGTARQEVQGGDQHWIHRRDVARFIVDNAAAVDLRKVDKFWFIELLATCGAGSAASGKSVGARVISLAQSRPDLAPREIAEIIGCTAGSVATTLSKARAAGVPLQPPRRGRSAASAIEAAE